MKKIGAIILGMALLLITGCMDMKMDINIKNNDTGQITMTMAFAETLFDDDDDFSINPQQMIDELEEHWEEENAAVSDYNFKKEDVNYIGKKISIQFQSLEELNNLMTEMMIDEDNEEMNITGEDTIQFARNGDQVTIKLPGDPESGEEAAMMASFLDYTVNITLEGEIISHNATQVDENKNTLTWTLVPLLKNGINVTYNTSKTTFNSLTYYIIGGILVLLFITGFFWSRIQTNNNI